MENIILSAFLLGFISISSQIILLRELLAGFYGNELSIGIIFALWMAFAGIGALFGTLHISRKKVPIPLLAAILLPLTLVGARTFKGLLHIVPFEMLGLGTIFLSSSIMLLPLGIVFGAWFSMCSNLSGNPSKVYFYESVGLIAGAAFTGLVFIPLLNNFQAILLLSGLSLSGKKGTGAFSTGLAAAAVLAILFIFGIPSKMEHFTTAYRFKPFTVAASKDTVYGSIAVLKLGNAYSFYENGAKIASTADKQYAEEIAYFSMLSAKPCNLRTGPRILLIGGSVSGILPEILKYGAGEVVALEIDPEIINLGRKYIEISQVKQVKIVNEDGRRYVRRAFSSGEKFESVIVSLSDPVSGLVNRFYTVEFFREIKKVLARDGIFTTTITAPEEYVSRELGFLSSSLYKTLGIVFKYNIVIPGARSYFISSDAPLNDSAEYFLKTASRGKIKPVYLTPVYVKYLLKPDRLGALRNKILSGESTRAAINTDMKPVSYLYGLIYWVLRAGWNIPMAIYSFNGNPIPFLAIISMAVMVLMFLRLRKTGPNNKAAISVSVALVSFSSFIVELAIIFAFQAVYGYVYYLISFLLASFMAGLALGTHINKLHLPRPAFYSSIFMAVFSLVIPAAFNYNFPLLFWFLIIFIAGIPVGVAFNSANLLIENSAGLVYGADLWGAAAAALIGSVILFPVLGISFTCLVAAAAAAVASISFCGSDTG